MLSSTHGNERTFLDIEVPVMADGTILGVKARPSTTWVLPALRAARRRDLVPGAYGLLQVQECQVDFTSALTNKCP